MNSPSYSPPRDPKPQDKPENSSKAIPTDFESTYLGDFDKKHVVTADKGVIKVRAVTEESPWLECSVKEAFVLGHLLVAAAASSADTE